MTIYQLMILTSLSFSVASHLQEDIENATKVTTQVEMVGMKGKLPQRIGCNGQSCKIKVTLTLSDSKENPEELNNSNYVSTNSNINLADFLSADKEETVHFEQDDILKFYLNSSVLPSECKYFTNFDLAKKGATTEVYLQNGTTFEATFVDPKLTFFCRLTYSCLPHFYRSNCTTHCKPKKDDNYYCLKNGTRKCNESYYSPPLCQNRNHCHPADRCKNNGTCIVEEEQCYCKLPYYGKNCENKTDICSLCNTQTQICMSGKEDIREACICKDNYVQDGKTGKCKPNPNVCQCLNNATCSQVNGDAKCNCTTGFEGSLCENDINECSDREKYCKYALSCNNTFGGYFCKCKKPAFGRNCDKCEVSLDRWGKCVYGFNDKYFWYAIFVALALILYSCFLSAYFWRQSVEDARSALTQRIIAQRLANAAANIRN